MNCSDHNLIESIQKGDLHAFEQLVKRYQSPIFNFILRYLGDVCSAEDLTQEVFLRIYRSIGKFQVRPQAKPSTWMFKIAYNLAMNEIKRQKRFKEFQRKVCTLNEEKSTAVIPEPIKYHDLKNTILAALEHIPENQRAALLLRVNEGFSYREISEILNVTVSSVESLIFRARNHLKQYLSL